MKLSTVNTYCSAHVIVPKTAPKKGKDADKKHIHHQRLNLAVTETRREARVSDLSTQTHTHRHASVTSAHTQTDTHTSQCDLIMHTRTHTHPSEAENRRHQEPASHCSLYVPKTGTPEDGLVLHVKLNILPADDPAIQQAFLTSGRCRAVAGILGTQT